MSHGKKNIFHAALVAVKAKGFTIFYKSFLFISLSAIYLWFIRPFQLRWGATDGELTRSMADDEVVQSPTFNAKRAVAIEAQPEHIFPWITQIGVTRAGWYSIDLFDNLGKPSTEVIR